MMCTFDEFVNHVCEFVHHEFVGNASDEFVDHNGEKGSEAWRDREGGDRGREGKRVEEREGESRRGR